MSSNPSPLDAVQFGPQDVASPAPVDTSSLPVQTPVDQIVAPQPDVAGGVQPNQMPDVQGSNPTAVAQPPKPSAWKNILIGALQGLAAGGGNPMGIVRGALSTAATGETPVQQLRVANAQRQDAIETKLRFEHFQAAHAQAENMAYAHALGQLPIEDQRAATEYNMKIGTWLTNAGFVPVAVAAHDDDASQQQRAATPAAFFGQMADANNGQIPATINLPIAGHTIAFALPKGNATDAQVSGLNELLLTAGLPTVDAAAFNSMAQKDRDALFLKTVESNRAELRPDQLAAAVARDAGILKKLQMTRSWDKDAIGLVKDRLNAETQASNSVTTMQRNKAAYEQQLKDNSTRVQQQNANFIDSNYIKPALNVEMGYQKFMSAYNDFQHGAKSGAASMVALSTHLATTFGSVKGARVTKDMIREHLGARSVSDDALVATQKLVNGDVLSPQQWQDFKALISNSRQIAWQEATQQAIARHMSVSDIAARAPKDLVRTATNPKSGQKIISVAGSPWQVVNPNGGVQ